MQTARTGAARSHWIFVFQLTIRRSYTEGSFIDHEQFAAFGFGQRIGFNRRTDHRIIKAELMCQPEYDDSYRTCAKTYSTLRVFSDDIAPDEITKLLQTEPTETFRKGDSYSLGKLQRKTNGWFYSTEKLSSSRDTRRHIDLILATLDGKADSVDKLHSEGCKIDLSSYWESVGQGGPWLMPQQMLKLGTLGIDVWWDIYFTGEDKA